MDEWAFVENEIVEGVHVAWSHHAATGLWAAMGAEPRAQGLCVIDKDRDAARARVAPVQAALTAYRVALETTAPSPSEKSENSAGGAGG